MANKEENIEKQIQNVDKKSRELQGQTERPTQKHRMKTKEKQ